MKLRHLLFGLMALGLSLSLGGCSKGSADLASAPTFVEQAFTDFTAGHSDIYTVSNGWSNKGSFGVTWSSANAVYGQDGLTMSITKDGDVYYGGEQKTTKVGDLSGQFAYGYFGTTMKPCGVNGVASTFFTYTGPTEDNPHDEIDIEFLGKDCTEVQFNYFSNGVGKHEYMYSLGFDASKDFHQYGFYWDETQIVWYVDLKPVYRAVDNIPTTPQRIFQNTWIGNQTNSIVKWMGTFDDADLGCTAVYKKVTYADKEGKAVAVPEPEKAPSLENCTAIEGGLPFKSAREYVVVDSADNTSADVTYEGVSKNYHNIISALPARAKSNALFAMSIENKGSAMVTVRMDLLMDAALVDGGIKVANVSGYYGGGSRVKTDLTWGGSFFEIPAGESKVVIVKYYGPATSVLLMIDSTLTGTHSGHIALSNYLLGGVNEYVAPTPTTPVIDESLGQDFTLTLPSNEFIAVTGDATAATLTYNDIAGNSYHNVYGSVDTAVFANTIALSLHVKNSGSADLRLRVDVNNVVGTTRTHLNTSADGSDVSNVTTDTKYGGSFATIAPGVEGVFRVFYSGEATEIMLFPDSSTYSDSATHSNVVTVSNYKVYGA